MEEIQDTLAVVDPVYTPTYAYEVMFQSSQEADLVEILVLFKQQFPNVKVKRILAW